jgi:hypothetical protein
VIKENIERMTQQRLTIQQSVLFRTVSAESFTAAGGGDEHVEGRAGSAFLLGFRGGSHLLNPGVSMYKCVDIPSGSKNQ